MVHRDDSMDILGAIPTVCPHTHKYIHIIASFAEVEITQIRCQDCGAPLEQVKYET